MVEQLMKRTGVFGLAGCRTGVLLILLAIFWSVCCTETFAEPVEKAEPIQIISRRLEADHAAGTVRFVGEVVATQGDMTIKAEELVVYQAKGEQRIDRIEAYRKVRITQGDRLATGQQAVFDKARGQVLLTGSPQVLQGDDFVQGDEIVFFLDSERSIVRSKGSQRVKAVFHPREGTSE